MMATPMTAEDNDTGDLVVRGRKPFAMIPTELARNPELGSAAVRLWTVLATYAYGSDVVTRPSRAALARNCGYSSVRAVDLNLRQLERAGWLTIEATRRADGGRGNNRYILEWDARIPPTATGSGQRGTTPQPDPAAGSRSSAGQTPVQNSAPGPVAPVTPAKESAGGPENEFVRAPAKESARQREITTTKNPSPPRAAASCAVATDLGVVDVEPALPVSGHEGKPSERAATDLAAAVKASIPSELARQIRTSVLRDRCMALTALGWTPERMASVARARSWTGAGPGAVVRWVGDLASDWSPAIGSPDRQVAIERQLAARKEHAAAMEAARAASGMRQEARRVAQELAARGRARRAEQIASNAGGKTDHGNRSAPDVASEAASTAAAGTEAT